ncbi:E3 ubiquitin-protein ligase NEURL3 [Ictalurus punctatus]|uniref:E3 ubiquitin-protein ligase NEURL3 n=1 Tax=Ictalurus punctatus TaxID=7998 RepID=A0A2D0QY61_ICTPU|nr:E3 ubiquitin-protein ligase NEURL3 [Ictalurus punctatus]
MARKTKGSKKKASFCTLLKSSPKFSATEDNCGVGQIPEEMLQRLMVRNSLNLNPPFFQRNAVTPRPCTCGICCLGPITFHPEVKGKHVKLSAGDRRATRNPLSFRHGVTFSSRPLRVGEKVRMRVERAVAAWHGALRIGFTTVPPGSGPMCPLAIPDLTDRQGFWALPIPENYSSPRTELTFWVKRTGYLRIQTDNGFDHKEEMSQMDTSKPIWAMIDVYGQTTSVLFLGSEKKTFFFTRRSCSVPKISATEQNCGYDPIPEELLVRMVNRKSLEENSPFFPSNDDNDEHCVVCYSETASVHLDCGHSCLCSQCAERVISDFGTCPLCRQSIRC